MRGWARWQNCQLHKPRLSIPRLGCWRPGSHCVPKPYSTAIPRRKPIYLCESVNVLGKGRRHTDAVSLGSPPPKVGRGQSATALELTRMFSLSCMRVLCSIFILSLSIAHHLLVTAVLYCIADEMKDHPIVNNISSSSYPHSKSPSLLFLNLPL